MLHTHTSRPKLLYSVALTSLSVGSFDLSTDSYGSYLLISQPCFTTLMSHIPLYLLVVTPYLYLTLSTHVHPSCGTFSEYGFAEKVVEGMSLSINSIVIRISAKAFNASFELSQLQVYSVNTSWSISDLRFTRIQDPQRGEVRIGFLLACCLSNVRLLLL